MQINREQMSSIKLLSAHGFNSNIKYVRTFWWIIIPFCRNTNNTTLILSSIISIFFKRANIKPGDHLALFHPSFFHLNVNVIARYLKFTNMIQKIMQKTYKEYIVPSSILWYLKRHLVVYASFLNRSVFVITTRFLLDSIVLV